jgi:hypothetical protein
MARHRASGQRAGRPSAAAVGPARSGTFPRVSHARRWWVLGTLTGVAALVPAHRLSTLPPINRDFWAPGRRHEVLVQVFGDLGAWWLLFAVTAFALLHAPRRLAVVTALVLGAAAGIASLAHTAVLSDDLYRYAWDGRVQASGTNPYRYAPDDPALADQRDPWLWPSAAECADRGKNDPCTRINRPSVRTIYPPGAQAWFLLGRAVLPAAARDLGWELLGLLVATATGVLIAWVLHRTGRDPRWVVLWACCPAVPLEAVQNAHVDSLAALLVAACAAVLLTGGGRPGLSGPGLSRRRTVAAAVLLAAAGLVKLYPFVLLPALFQRHRPLAWVVVAALTLGAYLPYVLGVGGGVLGYLRGYLQEQGYDQGGRFALLALTGLHGTPVKLLAYAIVAGVLVLALLRRLGPPLPAALTVFATLLLVATPGEAWYELVLLVLIALTGRWQWCLIIVADYTGYLTAMLAAPNDVTTRGSYLLALVVGVGVTVHQDRAARRRGDAADGTPALVAPPARPDGPAH